MYISNKKIDIKYIISIILICLGILFSLKDFLVHEYKEKYEYSYHKDLLMYYKKIDSCFFDSKTIQLINNMPGDFISVINVGTFSNILPIFSNKIPVNYYLFYAETVIQDNFSWQKNEINNLEKFKPLITVISKNICKVIPHDDLILDHLNIYYKLIVDGDGYLIFVRKNNV